MKASCPSLGAKTKTKMRDYFLFSEWNFVLHFQFFQVYDEISIAD